jgi:hypothetical protein
MQALTLPDGRRITAKDYRHLFATAWRDYINTPSTQLHNLTLHELDAAAADCMCSSTYAFNTAYDDSNRQRGMLTILEQWIKFKEFVKRQWEVQQSEG